MYREGLSIKKIAVNESKADRTIYKYITLNYLSPRIINKVMKDKVPAHINVQALFKIASQYPDFQDQERAFRVCETDLTR